MVKHHPTAPELEVLKLLWNTQPRTGKEIHKVLTALYGWSYSSTRKTLERMSAKHFVRTTTLGNKNLYYAELEKMPTLAAFASDFARRILEIDTPLPVNFFSDSHLINKDELAELEALLQEAPAHSLNKGDTA
ncbi:BlaI/MecI/CopY family transcriptional regulator [Lacimicrobium alkaliphilum]|uniref:Penicillinase repressor n=1 Tax=Lacimicrobium alkaliphilum TaxID=1526571 RepID=A0ABQ1R6B7_9ALTE|nr:BlaI/MecI/CopY family transcriptional regulator [Lacimicrobium alkaliphilum]GGD59838.1 hypothetical protein GCM10011357_13890 [Lacimicrobium alkaliphilum]